MQSISSWTELDFEKHIFFNLNDEIDKIIAPLKVHFGLDSFNYHKTYHDNSQIRLTNTPEWKRHYLMNKLYQQSIFELPAHNYSRNRIIWSNINTHNVILQAATKFGINYGITLIEPCADGCEFYFLGTTSNDNSVINNYLSNFQLVEKFVVNFKDSGKSILERVKKERVSVDDWYSNDLNFNAANKIDKYSFLVTLYGYNFTPRETQCLPLLLNGFSSKQIAEYLNLSFRTVEDYINSIKQKCNTKTKNELLKLLSDQFN